MEILIEEDGMNRGVRGFPRKTEKLVGRVSNSNCCREFSKN